MVLQTFIQSMLPKDTQSVYGEGMAGEMWQSLLAQQLGDTMAARGGIGIADRVLGAHYERVADAANTAAASSDHRAERDLQEMLSVALVQEIQRKTTRSMNEEGAISSVTSSRDQ
jgi:Rod binding domain-containing protein